MSTTSAYGWNIPDNTDLVKDGALAIRTLGNAIDTSMNTALGTKKAGMVLLNTTSFSAVSSFSLPANTFTATYENYKVLITLNTSANDTDFFLRLRASGSDNSTNNYFYGIYSFRSNNTANNYGAASVSNISIGQTESGRATSDDYYYTVDISQPFLTRNTKIVFQGQDLDGSSNFTSRGGGGILNVSSSFDSASFIVGAGTITGKYSVYGYNL